MPAPSARVGLWGDGPLLAGVTWMVAMVATILTATAVAVVFVAIAASNGERDPGRLEQAAQSPIATWISLIATQMVMLAIALIACFVARARVWSRLGLAPTRLRLLPATVLVIASVTPFTIGILAATLVATVASFGGESGMTRMWAEGSRTASVCWVLVIALFPGFIEELFYRGFLLRGFLSRWSAPSAIALTSVLFGIAHLDPPSLAFTTILGAWFGIVAWRTQSTRLPIVMHVLVNGSWTVVQMMLARRPMSDEFVTLAAVGAITVGFVAFLWAITILRDLKPPTQSPALASALTPAPRFTVAWCVGALLVAIAGLTVILPSGSGSSRTPDALRERAAVRATCDGETETLVALRRDEAVRVRFTPNRAGIEEVILALDATRDTLWLLHGDDLSGKRIGAGVLEQLVASDPTRLCIRLSETPTGIDARCSLLEDERSIEAALQRAASESGWATRGR